MNPFAGKSTDERNKMIVAIVLGVLALASLFFAFGGTSLFSSSTATKVTVSVSPTPKPSASVPLDPVKMPSESDQLLEYSSVPVRYNGVVSGPDPGRNIFAFYEPPPPCGMTPANPCPPPPTPKVTPMPPPPTPEIFITAINPSSVYAGSKNVRLEIVGERMQPDAKIYLNQTEVPTRFVNEQRMTADIPASFISSEGGRQIIIQTPDGKKYSQAMTLNVQAPPRPQFQYIGMIARRGGNNDTAYFMEQGRQTPMSARLNDVLGQRFKLISISSDQTIFEDVNLGFRHQVPLYRPAPGTASSSGPTRSSGFPAGENYQPYNPGTNYQVPPGQSIPGIPDNIPRYIPPNANVNVPNRPPPEKKDADDEDGDGKP
jgi:hypothetical protein